MNEQMYSSARLEQQRISLGELLNQSMAIQPVPMADWMESKACDGVDPNVFFPETGAEVEDAKAICMNCVVRMHCLRYAIDNRIHHGVWGGLSELQLRRIQKIRARMVNSSQIFFDLASSE